MKLAVTKKATTTPKSSKAKKAKDPEAVKRGKRSKNKGASYEREVASKFKKFYGVELVRTPQSGGFVKNAKKATEFRGDVVPADDFIDLHIHIECKNTQRLHLLDWIEQAEGDCPDGKIPTVVFHRYGTSKDYVCLSLEDFFNLTERDKVVSIKE